MMRLHNFSLSQMIFDKENIKYRIKEDETEEFRMPVLLTSNVMSE